MRPSSAEIAALTDLQRLTAIPEERQILIKYFAQFKSLVNAETFNEPVASGPLQGTTPLFWLMGTPEGQQLLLDNWSFFLPFITPTGLHHTAALSGPNQGRTPFSCLPGTPDGLEIISTHWDDIQKLTNEVEWLAVDKLFLWLAGREHGQQLLLDHADFFLELITPEALNQHGLGEDSDETAFICLATNPIGQQFLMTHWERLGPMVSVSNDYESELRSQIEHAVTVRASEMPVAVDQTQSTHVPQRPASAESPQDRLARFKAKQAELELLRKASMFPDRPATAPLSDKENKGVPPLQPKMGF